MRTRANSPPRRCSCTTSINTHLYYTYHGCSSSVTQHSKTQASLFNPCNNTTFYQNHLKWNEEQSDNAMTTTIFFGMYYNVDFDIKIAQTRLDPWYRLGVQFSKFLENGRHIEFVQMEEETV